MVNPAIFDAHFMHSVCTGHMLSKIVGIEGTGLTGPRWWLPRLQAERPADVFRCLGVQQSPPCPRHAVGAVVHLDSWGLSPSRRADAVALGRTPSTGSAVCTRRWRCTDRTQRCRGGQSDAKLIGKPVALAYSLAVANRWLACRRGQRMHLPARPGMRIASRERSGGEHAAGRAVHSRRLGPQPVARGERRRRSADAELRPDLGELPARDARRARAGRRAARGADGQLRGRAHQHRRRPGGLDGPAADRQRDRRRQLRRQSRARALHRGAEGERRAPRISPGSPRRAGCTRTSGTSRRRRRRSRRPGVPVAVHAFLDGRDVPPSSAAGAGRRARGGAAGRRAHRHGLGAVLRDGPRQALGAGGAGGRRRSCAARGRGRRAPRRRSRRPTRAARPTSS